MTKVTILHYSDAHWHPANAADLSKVIAAMTEDLGRLKREKSVDVDFVIFSGDLVLAGECAEDFFRADSDIVEPILRTTNTPRDHFFICPGNHDISRKLVRENDILEAGLKAKLASVDAVNHWVEKVEAGDPVAGLSVARGANFEEFYKARMAGPIARYGMVKTFKLDIRGVVVGLACFDNSWRSSGEHNADRQSLLLGERNVDFAIDSLKGADLAIANFHHPMTWLADFEAAAVGPRLFKDFDILTYGHMHAAEPEIRKTVSGTAVLCQSGSVFSGRKYFNGYQILEVDTEICEVKVFLRAYFDTPTPHFSSAENIIIGGEMVLDYSSSRGKSDPSIERYLRAIRPVIRQQALDQFNISDIGAEICTDPHTAFICPPIFLKGGVVELEDSDVRTDDPEGHSGKSEDAEISLDSLLERNESILISGGRELGKTSLAHFIAVKVADGECDTSRIPIVIDFRNFAGNLYSLKRQAAAYLGVQSPGFDIEAALVAGGIMVILDNFSGQDSGQKANLRKLIEAYPTVRWVLLADSRMGGTNKAVEGNDLIEGFLVTRIYTLPRKSIRELTRRWCERTGTDHEKTFTTVMKHITLSDLPRTGYIVTLLLWAIRQGDRLERVNEAVLIMNMVDYLLGKADFKKALEGEFDATSKEITLQSFAKFVGDRGGFVPINEAIQYLIEFYRERGLHYDSGAVLKALCSCGILVKRDGLISFKYRCFQAYFVARHLGSSEGRLKGAVFDRLYLRYQREIEILSGLNRENDLVVDELSLQVKNYAPEFIESVDLSAFDEIVDEEFSISVSRRKLKKIREKKLTAEQVDDLMDAAEAELSQRNKPKKGNDGPTNEVARPLVHQEESRAPSNSGEADGPVMSQPRLSVSAYMSTLSLLGKVIRNSEFADKKSKVDTVRLYIAATTKLFVHINAIVAEVFDNMVAYADGEEELLDAESRGALKYFLAKRIMLYSDSIIFNDIGGAKLIPIFEEILGANQVSFAEKTFLSGIQLDVGNDRWSFHWANLAHENKKRRIAVEFLVDKLWAHIHTKFLEAPERREVERMVAELELALGAPKQSRGKIMQRMRAVTEKRSREQEKDE